MELQQQDKKSFGSFHSDNVELLIRQPPDAYVEPQLPVPLGELLPDGFPSFGHGMRDTHFLLDPEWTFINHGAFGTPLRVAVEGGNLWRLHCARQPLRFIDRQLFPLIVWALRQLAAEVKAEPDEVVFLPNATTGLNTVVNSIELAEGDELYMLNIGYGSVKKMIAHKCEKVNAHMRVGEVIFPLNGPDDILEVVRNTLRPNTRLAIFDHVTSNTGLLMPINELIQICHSRGVPVLIDGAHGLGSIPLDLHAINADYYVSNAHKWFCCAPGCAFLYAKKRQNDRSMMTRVIPHNPAPSTTEELLEESKREANPIVPLVISHGFGEGFTSDFIWSGYQDYSAVLMFPHVLAFWKRIGLEKVWEYNSRLLQEAIDLLRDRWGTDLIAPMGMHRMMALVGVPDAAVASGKLNQATYEDAKTIQDKLHFDYMIEVPCKCVQGRLYLRLSAHIYNQLSDYERLADAMMDIGARNRTTTDSHGAQGDQ